MALMDAILRAVGGAAAAVGADPATQARLTPLDLARAERSYTAERDAAYHLYQDYYDGKQHDPRDIDFGDTAGRTRSPHFPARHNLCALVVDVLAERLAVTGVAAAGADSAAGPAQADALAETLWSWWQANRMDAVQITVHAQALIKGDAFLLCDYDGAAGRPRWTFHDALTVAPVYDAGHRMTAAFKVWTEDYEDGSGYPRTRRRITHYTPARIEKWANEGRGWVLWTFDTDAAGNPDGGVIDWTDTAGAPLGVPVIPFRNRPRGADYGTSELADVLPVQDEYNRRVWNTSEAMSYAGSPQKYVIDARAPASGSGYVSGPGRVWTIASAGAGVSAQAGQFPPSDLAQLQDATDRELKTLAGMTRTPLHLVWPEGGLPSGEALKTAEAGLVAKAKDRQVVFGNAWEDAFAYAVRLHNVFSGGPTLPEGLTLAVAWASPETRSDLAAEQTLALRAEDLSWQQRMRERGYDAETVARIREEKDTETPPALRDVDAELRRLQRAGSGDGGISPSGSGPDREPA